MGRWKTRNPHMSRDERARLTRLGRDFILELARERSWTFIWEFDDPFVAECIFPAGNPGLDDTLTICCVDGALSWWSWPDRPDRRWLRVSNAAERDVFVRGMDNWLEARRADPAGGMACVQET